jgi:hypothetical protein
MGKHFQKHRTSLQHETPLCEAMSESEVKRGARAGERPGTVYETVSGQLMQQLREKCLTLSRIVSLVLNYVAHYFRRGRI